MHDSRCYFQKYKILSACLFYTPTSNYILCCNETNTSLIMCDIDLNRSIIFSDRVLH